MHNSCLQPGSKPCLADPRQHLTYPSQEPGHRPPTGCKPTFNCIPPFIVELQSCRPRRSGQETRGVTPGVQSILAEGCSLEQRSAQPVAHVRPAVCPGTPHPAPRVSAYMGNRQRDSALSWEESKLILPPRVTFPTRANRYAINSSQLHVAWTPR